MDYLQKFRELLMASPKIQLAIAESENCDYNVFLYRSKNSYMCRGSSYLEDSLYCDISLKLKNCADCSYSTACELCFSCVDCDKIYNCNFCQDCRDSHDISLCYDCTACSNCFACVGLRHKEFYIFNQPYSKEDYFAELKRITADPAAVQAKFENLKLSVPRLYLQGTKNENSAGDNIVGCKNCDYSFGAIECQDCTYIYDELLKCRDSVDISHSHNSELCYDSLTMDNNYNCNFIFWGTNLRDCEFGYCIHGCSDCFMCTYIRQKKFYILNEPYSEEEYRKKVAEIKADLKKKGLYGQNLIYLALKETPEISQFFTA